MSMFRWLFPDNKLSRPDNGHGGDVKGELKGERTARRELLYAVVRDAMTRAGVLSASYKFKVLSLDSRGRQFLVMVDLAPEYGGETTQLAEIEALIAQSAKSRHDVIVSAVYWRCNEYVAAADSNVQLKSRASRPQPERPSPVAGLDFGPAPLAGATPVASRFEPIHSDEVAAFKSALAAGVRNPAAVAAAAAGIGHGASAKSFDGLSKQGPQSYTLLTGFEDTEMPDPDLRTPALSGTQYGDLR
jgi:hypothetical protein